MVSEEYDDANFYYADPVTFPDGTMMVKAVVTVDGKQMEQTLPVMDNRNRAIANPDARAISDAQQGALVKCLSLFGVGIGLYLGKVKHVIEKSNYEKAEDYLTAQDSMGFHEFVHGLSERDQTDAFNDAPPGRKSAYKSEWRALMKVADSFLDEVASSIGDAAANDDEVLLAETISELSTYERKAVWGRLDVAEQEYVQRARSAT